MHVQLSIEPICFRRFLSIASELERLESEREKCKNLSSFSTLSKSYGDNSNSVLVVATMSTSSSSPSTSSSSPNVIYSSSYSPTELSPINCNDLIGNNNSLDIESSQCSSPMSIGSMSSINSNRSHDGVFLRPGAVSRYVAINIYILCVIRLSNNCVPVFL